MHVFDRKGVAASGVIVLSLAVILATSGCLGGAQAVCKFDLSVSTTTHIGQYYDILDEYQWEAGAGNKFAVVTIKLANEADKSVSTNAFYWTLTVSGIEYSAHTATWDDSIGYQSVDVGKGGEFTTKIVYEVPAGASSYSLSYQGFDAPKMVQDNSLL